MSATDVAISNIMKKSCARNSKSACAMYSKALLIFLVTMKFEPTYTIASGLYSDSLKKPTDGHYFNASVTIRIPESPIRYTPEMSVVLKDAWIQYIAFFAVISFLVFRLNSFVFRYQVR